MEPGDDLEVTLLVLSSILNSAPEAQLSFLCYSWVSAFLHVGVLWGNFEKKICWNWLQNSGDGSPILVFIKNSSGGFWWTKVKNLWCKLSWRQPSKIWGAIRLLFLVQAPFPLPWWLAPASIPTHVLYTLIICRCQQSDREPGNTKWQILVAGNPQEKLNQ